LRVAFGTHNRSVPTKKLEAGILVVLEIKRLPAETYCAVARLAALSQLPQVDVRVAGRAECFERLVADRFRKPGRKLCLLHPMALGAIDRHMLSGKRIPGVLMVTGPPLEPVHYVTGGAILVELSPMRIVSVAVRTKREGSTLESLIHMTLRTGQWPVHAT